MKSIEYNNQAIKHYNKAEYKEAEIFFKKAIEQDPNYAEAYSNLGALYAKLKLFDKAIALYQKAIELKPSYAGAYTNMGNALNKTSRHEEAVYFHKLAISLDSNAANHFSNCASAYKNLGRFNLAKLYYIEALKRDKYHVNAHFDLATILLQTGEYEAGWREYEWRFYKEEMKGHIALYREIFKAQRYNGKKLENKERILVHAEQGYGDLFMVARYLYALKEKGATVVLYTREGSKELFESFTCVDEVHERDEKLPPFDMHIPFMSLPFVFDAKLQCINTHYPYIHVQQKAKLPKSAKLNIGVVWGASKTGESYKNKVFDVRHFRLLSQAKEVQLYSLQLGEDAKDLQKYNLKNIIDLQERLTNFYETATYINALDLVITSDTSVAHLAGAMGKEVWVVLQKVPDWRWGICGENSLWYKSAKLFFQDSLQDFNSAFKKLYKALEKHYNIKVLHD